MYFSFEQLIAFSIAFLGNVLRVYKALAVAASKEVVFVAVGLGDEIADLFNIPKKWDPDMDVIWILLDEGRSFKATLCPWYPRGFNQLTGIWNGVLDLKWDKYKWKLQTIKRLVLEVLWEQQAIVPYIPRTMVVYEPCAVDIAIYQLLIVFIYDAIQMIASAILAIPQMIASAIVAYYNMVLDMPRYCILAIYNMVSDIPCYCTDLVVYLPRDIVVYKKPCSDIAIYYVFQIIAYAILAIYRGLQVVIYQNPVTDMVIYKKPCTDIVVYKKPVTAIVSYQHDYQKLVFYYVLQMIAYAILAFYRGLQVQAMLQYQAERKVFMMVIAIEDAFLAIEGPLSFISDFKNVVADIKLTATPAIEDVPADNEIAPVIQEYYDCYNEPLAELAFEDMTFSEDNERITILDDEDDHAPVEIAPDEIAFDEIVPDAIFEIPVAAPKKKKFRLFRKNSKSTLETTPEAAMEQAAKKQKRPTFKGALHKTNKELRKAGKKFTQAANSTRNLFGRKKKHQSREKSSH